MPEQLPHALEDLLDFLNGSATGPLIRAGLVHAQFETLHPFADGNGWIGRALAHTALVRSGLIQAAVLPISHVFMTRSKEYIAALMAYRGLTGHKDFATHSEPQRDLSVDAGVSAWLDFFLAATDAGIDLATELKSELDEFGLDARQRIRESAAQNRQREPRRDSTVWKILEALPRLPVTSVQAAAKITSTSADSARNALVDLEKSVILNTKT